MQSEFLICEFAKETLSNLVKERFGAEFPDINSKNQIQYLYNYLCEFDTKTILLESDYVDRDYLEDYSRYYVKCFNRYGERCARLHFFSDSFDHKDFTGYLSEFDDEIGSKLSASYIGFIVIKPLPKTFIGKTCLKSYDSFDGSKSKKVITREYNVNLFGIPLSVNTVAFQEQDKVVSACATTAIWTALQALDIKDLRTVPSLSEITLSAINHISGSHNSFPNKGLTNKQILRALDVQQLRNHKINISSNDEGAAETFYNIIKSYLQSDLPLIMGADVYSIDESEEGFSEGRGHAVTILGYKESDDEKYIYIHDDRIGPFARAKIAPVKTLIEYEFKLEGSWGVILEEKDEEGSWVKSTQILIPDSLIIPNYRKVRIPSDYIDNTCKSVLQEYGSYWTKYCEKEGIRIDEALKAVSYSISLVSLAKYKSRLINDSAPLNKDKILCKSLSKYIWCAKFECQGYTLFEVLFDSTDIPQGDAVSGIVIYDEKGYDTFKRPLENIQENAEQRKESKKDFLSALIKCFKEKAGSYNSYLNKRYGEPRAPIRINKEEIIENIRLHEQKNVKKYYGKQEMSLDDDIEGLIENDKDSFKIWVIAIDGALLIGEEINRRGHPTLTGFKAARVAGELKRKNGKWLINSKSGRYSSTYTNANELLANARHKFLEVYSQLSDNDIVIDEYHP